MKILVSYPAAHLTGASRYAAAVSRELAARGHEVVAVVDGDGGARRLFEEHSSHLRVERADTPNLAGSTGTALAHARGLFTGTREYVRLIRKFQPDVLLAHSVFNLWSVLASRRTSIPLVALLHELPANYPPPLYRIWKAFLLRSAHRVIVTSEEMAKAIATPSLTTIVPVGVDTEVFHSGVDGQSARSALNGAAAGPLVVCPSHLMESKGQLDLVEAIPAVVERNHDLKLFFVGSTHQRPKNESFRNRLEKRARELNVDSHITLIGARIDMAPLLAAADLVVFPSHLESFGLVPLEAQAVGTPVVATEVGVVPKFARGRRSVTLVPPKSPERLGAAINEMLAVNPAEAEPVERNWTVRGSVDGIENELLTAIGRDPTSSSRARRAVVLAMERVSPPSSEGVRSVNVAVTYYCNSRCTMCSIWELYRNDRERAAAELSLPDIKDIFSSRRFDGLSTVALTGGEPFLRKDLVDIAGFFLERFPSAGINLPTDSVSPGLTIRKVRKILERYAPTKNRLSVTVSLDGRRDAHNRQRGVDCFDKAIEVLETLATMDVSLNVSFTITPLNASDVYATYEIAKSLGADFSMQFGQGSSHYYGERSLADRGWRERELARVEGQIIDIADERWESLSTKSRVVDTVDYFMRRMVDYHRSPRRIFTCYSGTHSCFIDPYGDVYPCLMLDKKLGNAKRDGFDAVWDGPIAQEVRKSIARKECHCWTPCEACPSLGRSINPSLSALTRLHRKRRAAM